LALHIIENSAQEYCYNLETTRYYEDSKLIVEINKKANIIIIDKMLDNLPSSMISIYLSNFIQSCKNSLQNNLIINKRK
jgi:hypothetical protein